EAGAAADPEGHPEAVQEALDLGQQAVHFEAEQLRLGALVPAVLVVEGPGTRCVALHKGLLLQKGLRPGRGKGLHPAAKVQGQDLHPGDKAQTALSSSSRGNRICYRAGSSLVVSATFPQVPQLAPRCRRGTPKSAGAVRVAAVCFRGCRMPPEVTGTLVEDHDVQREVPQSYEVVCGDEDLQAVGQHPGIRDRQPGRPVARLREQGRELLFLEGANGAHLLARKLSQGTELDDRLLAQGRRTAGPVSQRRLLRKALQGILVQDKEREARLLRSAGHVLDHFLKAESSRGRLFWLRVEGVLKHEGLQNQQSRATRQQADESCRVSGHSRRSWVAGLAS
ncbi:unnamed protein product, partial [Ixodes pacificus]